MTTPDDHPDLDPMARRVAEPATITRAVLRRLLDLALTHTANPALARLPDDQRTVAGLARAYVPWSLYLHHPGQVSFCVRVEHALWTDGAFSALLPTMLLDLHDPGAANALLIALALAHGYDPGEAALGVSWDLIGGIWTLTAGKSWAFFETEGQSQDGVERYEDIGATWWSAPEVYAEQGHVRALVLAVLHVLKHYGAP